VLVWQADTATMHPNLDRKSSPRLTRTIPSPQRPSTGSRSDRTSKGYLAREALDAAIVRGRYELPPLPEGVQNARSAAAPARSP